MDAATDLFAEHGLEVGFDQIARVAGVGVGTVYRRFPDRNALVEVLFAEKVEQLVTVARQALDDPDPWKGLVSFFETSILEQQRDRGLAEVLSSGDRGRDLLNGLRDRVSEAVGELVARAQASGVLRVDLTAVDLAVMMHLVSRIDVGDGSDLWRRYFALTLDAVRPRDGQPDLPGEAPSWPTLETVAHRL